MSGQNALAIPKTRVAEGDILEKKVYHDAVGTKVPREARRRLVSFPAGGPIPPDQSISLTVRPEGLFRADRLIIPDRFADDFDIVDIRIGRNSQLWTPGPLPASTFKESAIPVLLQMDVCNHAMDITIVAHNTSGIGQPRFSAVMAGIFIE